MFPLSNQMTAKEVHQGEVVFCLHFTFGSERTRKKRKRDKKKTRAHLW